MDGSDDLFGGLPAVSNAENSTTTAAAVTAAISNAADADPRPKPAPAAEDNDDIDKNSSVKRGTGEGGSSSSSTSSLVSSLGKAGTAMVSPDPAQAFVPHAIRNKRKGTAPPRPRALAKPNSSGGEISRVRVGSNEEEDGLQQISELVATEITCENDDGVADHGNDGFEGDEDNARDNDDNDHANANEPYLEDEPEALRLLHASVVQPYDPYLPNDYLAHRERKKTEQVRRDMQRSALQRLEQQEKLRRKIEEERKKILESGDFRKIVERSRDGDVAKSGGAAGRGRGRGVTNLPAWLVKKQEEQKEEEEEEGEEEKEEKEDKEDLAMMASYSSGPIDDGRFEDPLT
ncbi:hypothetical protein ACHAW5_006719 [Stephanodiscus triporus]|uniref:Uncharacterized protein n=1 Tax=Stephanodiscus triporus TaxID=2934178 RepID=A0ABD3MXH1_9STRA